MFYVLSFDFTNKELLHSVIYQKVQNPKLKVCMYSWICYEDLVKTSIIDM